MLNRLTVLYDSRCGVCVRARRWLERTPQLVPLEFVAAGSPEAESRFPRLDSESTLEELTAVGDGGEVYRGAKAWLMCLWALEEYRGVALRFAAPGRIERARRWIGLASDNRRRLDGLLKPGAT